LHISAPLVIFFTSFFLYFDFFMISSSHFLISFSSIFVLCWANHSATVFSSSSVPFHFGLCFLPSSFFSFLSSNPFIHSAFLLRPTPERSVIFFFPFSSFSSSSSSHFSSLSIGSVFWAFIAWHLLHLYLRNTSFPD
jgi:hypothetical protein